MKSSDKILRELHRYTPVNWVIRSPQNVPAVVIQATSEEIARERVSRLYDEFPGLPRQFTVERHEGPIRCAFFSEGFFHVREEIDRADADAKR